MKIPTTDMPPEELRFLQRARTDRTALSKLGYLFESGQIGGKPDYKRARYYYKLGAATDPHGLVFLGQLYQFGRGVRQNYKRAATLFRKAHRAGVVSAAIHLGNMYETGASGFPRNITQAIHWYQLGSAGGNRLALDMLMKAKREP